LTNLKIHCYCWLLCFKGLLKLQWRIAKENWLIFKFLDSIEFKTILSSREETHPSQTGFIWDKQNFHKILWTVLQSYFPFRFTLLFRWLYFKTSKFLFFKFILIFLKSVLTVPFFRFNWSKCYNYSSKTRKGHSKTFSDFN
jgi:hypothetical protein